MPKAKICYICGRPTLLPGYAQHVVQCRDLYERREMVKPAKERRPLPPDPSQYMSSSGLGGDNFDEYNDAAMKSFNNTLVPCQYCGRKFLPEKLAIHNRSCTASNPAKRVGGHDDTQGLSTTSRTTGYHDYDDDYEVNRNSVRTGGGGGYSHPSKGMGSKYDEPDADSFSNLSLSRSGKISGGTRKMPAGGNKFDESQFPSYPALDKCPTCGRNFNPVSFDK
jgi:DNA-directed RNA polymerase subunit RPC12/RpoP